MEVNTTEISALKWTAGEMLATALKVHLGSQFEKIEDVVLVTAADSEKESVFVVASCIVVTKHARINVVLEEDFQKKNGNWQLQGQHAVVKDTADIHKHPWFKLFPSKSMIGYVATEAMFLTDKLKGAVGTSQYHRKILPDKWGAITVLGAVEAGIEFQS